MTVIARCKVHPNAEAPYTCGMCYSAMCDNCTVYGKDGLLVCRRCQEGGRPVAPPLVVESREIPLRVQTAAPSPFAIPPAQKRQVMRCLAHPEIDAVTQCFACRKPICAVCDFAFPGGIHLCPACATDPAMKLSPRRKAKMMWSTVLGAVAVAGTFGLFLLQVMGGLDEDLAAVIICAGVIFGVAAVVGFVLGLTNFNKRAGNPGSLWIGVVLNGVVVALWVLLIFTFAMRMMSR